MIVIKSTARRKETVSPESRERELQMVTLHPCSPTWWQKPCIRAPGEAVNKEAPIALTFLVAPGSKDNTWVYWPGYEEEIAMDEKGIENKEPRKTSLCPYWSGSSRRPGEYCLGEALFSRGVRKVLRSTWERRGCPRPFPQFPPSGQFGSDEDQPSENTDKQEEERDGALEEAENSEEKRRRKMKTVIWYQLRKREKLLYPAPSQQLAGGLGVSTWRGRVRQRRKMSGRRSQTQDSDLQAGSEKILTRAWVLPSGPNSLLRTWTDPSREGTRKRKLTKDWEGAERPLLYGGHQWPWRDVPAVWATPKQSLQQQSRLRLSETPYQVLNTESPLKARQVCTSKKVTTHFLAVWTGSVWISGYQDP